MVHPADDSIRLLAARLADLIAEIHDRERSEDTLDRWLSVEEGRPAHYRAAYEAKCLAELAHEVKTLQHDAGSAGALRVARRYADRFGAFWWGGYDAVPDPAMELEAQARMEGYVSTLAPVAPPGPDPSPMTQAIPAA
jgi:hypothetical protein